MSEGTAARRVHAYAVAVAAATFVLVVAGGLVTSTGSSLSVPDWPLSYGQVMPPMKGGVLFEHGHRLVAAAVGLLTVVLAVVLFRCERRRGVRMLGLAAAGAVIVQGILGGVTVLMELPVAVSVAHGTLGQVFFVLVVLAALTTSQGWRGPAEGTVRGRRLTVAFFAAAFLQLILGAWMRHEGAGLAIPDFPLAMGRVVPPLDTFPVALHFAHRTWAVVVALLGVVTASRLLGGPATASRLRLPASVLLGLLALQIGLGGAVVLTLRSVVTTTSHVAVGALILATTAVLALEANRTALPSRRVEGRDDSREIACELAGGGVAP